ARRLVGFVVPSPGEEDPDTGRGETPLDSSGEVVGDLGLHQTVGHVAAVVPTVARVDDDDLAGQHASGSMDALGLAQSVRASTGDDRGEPREGLERGRTADAVDGHTHAALELPDG